MQGCEKCLSALFNPYAWPHAGPAQLELQTFLFIPVATNRTTFGCQYVGEILLLSLSPRPLLTDQRQTLSMLQ